MTRALALVTSRASLKKSLTADTVAANAALAARRALHRDKPQSVFDTLRHALKAESRVTGAVRRRVYLPELLRAAHAVSDEAKRCLFRSTLPRPGCVAAFVLL
jgi:hypothetical protein